jgi:hypothetical protein
MTTQEYRRENQQGAAQVESAELYARQNEGRRTATPTNDVDAETQSGRVPGSPMDPRGLEANQSGAAVKAEQAERMDNVRKASMERSASDTRVQSGQHDGKVVSLFPSNEAQTLRSRWDSIQTGFVDEPRQSVEQADQLVAEAMQKLSASFTNERDGLEQQWSKGDDVSTEDLRVALQRYRTFFDRLLAA